MKHFEYQIFSQRVNYHEICPYVLNIDQTIMTLSLTVMNLILTCFDLIEVLLLFEYSIVDLLSQYIFSGDWIVSTNCSLVTKLRTHII
jgi:hypothetical protein